MMPLEPKRKRPIGFAPWEKKDAGLFTQALILHNQRSWEIIMKMQFLAIVIVFIVFVLIQIVANKKKNAKTQDIPPYIRKKTLLGEREQVLFHRLVEAMPDHYVMAQVRLADIVGVKQCENWQSWFNKISRKSVDFVICNKSFVVLACIELDGKMHDQEHRQKADNTKDEALNAAGIPIVRIDANKLPPTGDIKMMLDNTIMKIQG